MMAETVRPGWWTTRHYAALLVLLSAIPLLWPTIPPITDLAGHLGRYRIELDLDRSPYLRQWFDFHWTLIGNLGVDLLILPLTHVLSLEHAVKLVVIAIPPLTVAGMLAVAREVHGRLPATAALALPLAYGQPFQFGFVNFALAMAFALLLFALWLRLGRLERCRLRGWLFLVIAPLLWTTHAFAWGYLGVLVFVGACHEAARSGTSWSRRALHVAIACAPLLPPALLMLPSGHAHAAQMTFDFFVWRAKLADALWLLRNWNRGFDTICAVLLYAAIVLAVIHKALRATGLLCVAAMALVAVFLLMPEVLTGSAFAAMRLAPFVLAIALLGVAPRVTDWRVHVLAAASVAFFLVRIAVHTVHYVTLDRAWTEQLQALDHVPRGARLFVMASAECGDWGERRVEHLGSLAIERRDAFANGQWTLSGAQLLAIHYPAAGDFTGDPTQILKPPACRDVRSYGLARALASLPRAAFDYVWLIDLPPGEWPHDPGLMPVWHARRGILYRIEPRPKQGPGTRA